MLLAPSLKKNVQGPSVTLQSLGRRSSIKWSRNNPVKSPGQPLFPLWMLILRVGRTPFSRAARTAGGDRAAERSWLRGTPASQAHRKKKREFGWARREPSLHRHTKYVCSRGGSTFWEDWQRWLRTAQRILPFLFSLCVFSPLSSSSWWGEDTPIKSLSPCLLSDSLPWEAGVKVQRSGGWSKRRFNHPCAKKRQRRDGRKSETERRNHVKGVEGKR